MDFQSLIGQTFQEMELFEVLQFEIEESFQKYVNIHLHIFFDRLPDNSVRISELVNYENADQLYVELRRNLEKREFYEIDYHGNINLNLVRLDRTSPFAGIRKNGGPTIRQDWGARYFADEILLEPLTEEEIRMGFAELQGCLEEYITYRDSKNKKAV